MTMLTDLLLFVRAGHECGAAAGMAAKLAARYGAQLEGVCLTALPPTRPEDCYATGGMALHDVIQRLEHETLAMTAPTEALVQAAMRAAECEFAWTVADPGELAAESALRCRLVDLVVISRPHMHDAALPLAECIVRLGGAPCLLTPETWDPARPLDHAVLAWNGSRQAKRAMDDAIPLLRDAKRISVLTVGSTEGCERQNEGLIAHLHRKGVAASMVVAPKAPHGDAILDWCGDHAADLLVMGAFGHTPRAERWFGGTTWTVLTEARSPVLMSC